MQRHKISLKSTIYNLAMMKSAENDPARNPNGQHFYISLNAH